MNVQKTLVIVLLITMSLSLLGTYSSLQRISGLKSLTGAWENGTTTRGSVNLTISQLVNINFTQDRVNFGAGFVTPGLAACQLETNTANPSCGWTYTTPRSALTLENQGNANVKLNLTNLNYSQSFIGGTNPGYAWSWNDPENDALQNTCARAAPVNVINEDTFVNISATNEVLNSSSQICSMFNASDSNDVINISFRLLIPSDAVAETGKFDTWTATVVAV